MSKNIDEEKLTSYALNDLTSDEQKEVEAYLRTNPEAKAYVDEIQQTESLLKSELVEVELDKDLKLTELQKKRLSKNLQAPKSSFNKEAFSAIGIAAGIVVVLGVLITTQKLDLTEGLNENVEVALNMSETAEPKAKQKSPSPSSEPSTSASQRSQFGGSPLPARGVSMMSAAELLESDKDSTRPRSRKSSAERSVQADSKEVAALSRQIPGQKIFDRMSQGLDLSQADHRARLAQRFEELSSTEKGLLMKALEDENLELPENLSSESLLNLLSQKN